MLLRKKTMKQLWVWFFLGLMIMVQPVYTSESPTSDYGIVPADAPPSSIRRIYGENVAQEVYADVTIADYREQVREFTENHSRYIMDYTAATVGPNLYARNYLMQQLVLLSNGRIEVETVGDHYNVVGRLPGYLPDENPVIVVSAHYDSAPNSDGANSDASGIATVLILARILSQYEWPLDIYFIAFNGLYTMEFMSGSPEVALVFQQEEIEILTMYNVDTILVQDPNVPISERIQMGYGYGGQLDYHRGQYWAELTRMISNNYGGNYVVPVHSSSFELWELSDHFTFHQRGFSGVLCAYESGSAIDQSSQTNDDRWDCPQYTYNVGRETTAVIGASIAFTMSREYGAPTLLTDAFTNGIGRFEMYLFAISTATVINVTSRWFGGSSTYYLVDEDLNIIDVQAFNESSPWEPVQIFSQQLTTKGTYRLYVLNTDFQPVGYEISITYESDIDGNGVLDRNEHWLDQSYFESDRDNDGVSDATEIFLGLNMNNEDSDSDSMDDKYEIDMGFDPADPSDGNQDADEDGLSNAQEYTGGLNPFSSDSDGDQMDDLWELTNGLNPLVDDAALDPDEDNISNLDEYLAGTNPHISDLEPVPMIWYVSPIVVIAPIVGVLYILRRNKLQMS